MKIDLHRKFLWFLMLFFTGIASAGAQSYVTEAQSHGFTLKKIVSDTAIDIGQNFTYTVYFSIPAGAGNVTITDVLSSNLTFQSINVTSACGTPGITTPSIGTSGPVTLSWSSVPNGCSGSFVVTVQFPPGLTCNGSAARNNVCLTAGLPGAQVDFCTGYIMTTARASDPWRIGKWVLNAAHQSGDCSYMTADTVVTYQICVYKDVGPTGHLDLSNAVVYDTLPPGAYLLNSTCNATQTGNVITWPVGFLSGSQMYTSSCCTYSVVYPSSIFTDGMKIYNKASLHGVLGSPNRPCGPAWHQSAETCVEIKSLSQSTLRKFVYTNGQPGCTGKYSVWLCNTGTQPLTQMTIFDTIPSILSNISLGTVSPGLSAALNGGIVTASLSTPLLPNQCRYFEVTFTIPANAGIGTVITNCAVITSTSVPSMRACASFTVQAPAPKLCLWKEVCNPQPNYSPGNTIRYRLRIQNIGGLPVSGATVTDILDPNLEYVGNPTYSTSLNWTDQCGQSPNWQGVSVVQNGNTLTFTLPDLPATCQNVYYGDCGMYNGGVPYHFIEFDVKISDSAALGNIPNTFSISGGNLGGSTTSNTYLLPVVGTIGFVLDKGVSDDTFQWGPFVNAQAASNVHYRLNLTVAPGSVGLRHVTFADLLPIDNNSSDNLILGPCGTRGSMYDVYYASSLTSSPPATEYNNNMSYSNVNIFTPVGAPAAMFTSGCGTQGSWSTGLSAGDQNLGWYFGASPITAGNSATTTFTASVSQSAKIQNRACNTFVANGAVRHLINNSFYVDQVTGNLESGAVCVNIIPDSVTTGACFQVALRQIVSAGVDAAGNCVYNIVVSTSNTSQPTNAYFESFAGVVNPSQLFIPVGVNIDTLTFTDLPPTDNFACIRFGYLSQSGIPTLCDSLCFDLPPCNDPCRNLGVKFQSLQVAGQDNSGNCIYSVSIDFSNQSGAPISVWYDSPQGSVTPVSASIPVGSSTQYFTLTDLPPADTFACLRFGVLQGNIPVVCDSICMDLPPCKKINPCDSLKADFQSITVSGSDPKGYCIYSVTVEFTNSSSNPMQAWFDSPQGALSTMNASLPVGSSTQTFTFIDLPPADTLACIRYGYIDVTGRPFVCDSICFDLPPCPRGDVCDSLEAKLQSVKVVGPNQRNDCVYTVTIDISNLSSNTQHVWFDSPQGMVTPGSSNVPVGGSTLTFSFIDTPPVDSTVCIRFGLVSPLGITIVCDSLCFDLPPCLRRDDQCDSLRFSVLDVKTVGADKDGNCVYDVNVHITNLSVFGTNIWLESTGGSVVPSSLNVPPGISTPTITFTDTSPQDSIVCIRIRTNAQGTQQVLCDSLCFRLQPCQESTELCDSLRFDVGTVTLTGQDGDGHCVYQVGLIVTNLSQTGTTVTLNSAQGMIIPVSLNVPSGSTTPFITYTHTSPEDLFACIRISIATAVASILCDSVCFDLKPCFTKICDSLIEVRIDTAKCAFMATLVNASATPITSIAYSITGGTLNYFNTTPCISMTPVVVGSTSGVLTYSPPCTATYLPFNLQIQPTTPSTPVTVTLTIYYRNDSCLIRFQYVCDSTMVFVEEERTSLPTTFELLRSFPNPAMQTVTIDYSLAVPLDIHLELYNQLGERVAVVWQGQQSPGTHTTSFNVSSLAAGSYILRLSTASGFVTRPLIITR